MAEKDKIGQISDPHPFHRNALIIMLAKLGDLRMMNNYFAVAEHARFKRRYSGVVGIDSPGMAEKTAYLFISCVNTMAEWDRLFLCGVYRADG